MLSRLRDWLRRKREARAAALPFERQVVVRWDEGEISASYPNGTTLAIAWSDVRCVAIETNDTGPLGADVWWLLEGGSSRCAFPQGATGETEAFEELPRRFSGFRHEMVQQAMVCADNARFVCWEQLSSI